jgi:transcriptional regulator with XRE-family HTH domain
MRDESAVWQALMRRKGLSVSDLAGQLGVTRQHAHRLLTGRRPAESQRPELESALALGAPTEGRPLFAIGELDDDGELELVPAGDAQPLFLERELAAHVATRLEQASVRVCVVPVWPAYAWRNLVAFHAAWGADPEPRKLFVVDEPNPPILVQALVDEICAGLESTLLTRARARDPVSLAEVEERLQRLH